MCLTNGRHPLQIAGHYLTATSNTTSTYRLPLQDSPRTVAAAAAAAAVVVAVRSSLFKSASLCVERRRIYNWVARSLCSLVRSLYLAGRRSVLCSMLSRADAAAKMTARASEQRTATRCVRFLSDCLRIRMFSCLLHRHRDRHSGDGHGNTPQAYG